MQSTLSRKIAVVMCALSTVVSGYFIFVNWKLMSEMIQRHPQSLEAPAAAEKNAEKNAEKGGEKSGEKGEKSAGKEGEKGAVASGGQSIVSVDEMWININSLETHDVRSVGIKLELELFSDADRQLIEQRQSGIKDVIIETSRQQYYDKLNTLSGKLYYKELLVARINEFLRKAAIREVHFSSFFLQ